MKARITIMPKEGILDPQGLIIGKALGSLGIKGVTGVRMGKYVELDLPRADKKKAASLTTEACEKLLANPNIEGYRFEIVESD